MNCEEPPPPTKQTGAGSRAVECPPSRQLRKYDPVPATGTGLWTTVSRQQLTESPAAKLTHFLPAVTSHITESLKLPVNRVETKYCINNS